MVSQKRTQRIADRIFEEISTILLMEVSDPRLDNVSVTNVRVDRELAFANIYVSSFEGSENADQILNGLEHAKGFLRSKLARRIQMRKMPFLRFFWDPLPEQADRIDQLISSLHDGELPDPSEAEEDTPDA
jgi:ribosome-binding factor A